ncbi:MAG: type II secretion system protein [Caldicoprobacterales bacterium]
MNKLLRKKLNKKGFTLIELIVVIAILGILAVILIPRFTGMRENANVRAVEANLRNLQSAVEFYAAENNKDVEKITINSDDEGDDGEAMMVKAMLKVN